MSSFSFAVFLLLPLPDWNGPSLVSMVAGRCTDNLVGRKDLILKEKVNVIECAKVNEYTQVWLPKKGWRYPQLKLLRNCKKKRKESEIKDVFLEWFSEKRARSVSPSG